MLPDTWRGLKGPYCDHNIGVRMSVRSWNISRPLQHVPNVDFFPLWYVPLCPWNWGGAQRKFGGTLKTFPAFVPLTSKPFWRLCIGLSVCGVLHWGLNKWTDQRDCGWQVSAQWHVKSLWSQWPLISSRTAVESKSNRICNHGIIQPSLYTAVSCSGAVRPAVRPSVIPVHVRKSKTECGI